MIRTKNLVTELCEIPISWIYEHYLTLPETLNGQDIKIKSVLSPKDTNPSFCIYYDSFNNKYKWKDFSGGKGGDGIQLVKELFNLSKRFEAVIKIINDYNEYILTNGVHSIEHFKIRAKYKIKAIGLRNWNIEDQRYWTQFKINSKLLDYFGVKPLSYFILYKENHTDILKIKSTKLYGYFRKDNTLYKIYQPLATDRKFFKVKNYLQGADQLTYKVPYLIIASSLKDSMAFHKLGFKNAEVIAPDSENTMIPEKSMQKLMNSYKAICTIFDNDEAGIRAMLKYKAQYNIPYAHLKFEKDLAECVQVHGLNNTRELLYPILTKALTGTIKELPYYK